MLPGMAVGRSTPESTCDDGRARNSKAWASLVAALKLTHVPPPPRLACDGSVTAIAKYVAITASAALPPAARMSRPISAACGSSATTAPKKSGVDTATPGTGGSRDEQPAITAALIAQTVN